MTTEAFKAIRLNQGEDGRTAELVALDEGSLPAGEVLVSVRNSSLNYKDALICCGRGGDIAAWPHVPGIDLAGEVLSSSSAAFGPGDLVLATGKAVGERVWGGFTQRTRLPAEKLLKLPAGLSPREAMAFGTAGLTAMLSILEIEAAGLTPDRGPVLVTGAGGGIGSLAVALLAQAGWQVTALERRPDDGFLTGLGASEVLTAEDFAALAGKPLGTERWAAAIDTVGGEVLAAVLRSARYGACIAACGMVAGFEVPMTLHPFFTRALRLVGIDSVTCPDAQRRQAWERLAAGAGVLQLEGLVEEIGLEAVMARLPGFLSGGVRGRLVVRVGA